MQPLASHHFEMGASHVEIGMALGLLRFELKHLFKSLDSFLHAHHLAKLGLGCGCQLVADLYSPHFAFVDLGKLSELLQFSFMTDPDCREINW